MKKLLPAFVLAGLLAPLCVRAKDDPAGLTDRSKQMELSLTPLVKNGDFAALDWPPQFVWKTDDYGQVALPPEPAAHRDGIYGVTAARAGLNLKSRKFPSVYSESALRVLKPEALVLTQEEAKTVASGYLHKHYDWFYQRRHKTVLRESPASPHGIFLFEWQQYGEDEMPSGHLQCEVRAIDGRITGFSAGEFHGKWEHKIKPSQALGLLVEKESSSGEVRDIEVTGWHPSGDRTQRYYVIGLKARRVRDNAVVSKGGQVDAMTGKFPGHSIEGWMLSRSSERETVRDQLPVWTQAGLVFSSNRRLSGLPAWVQPVPQVMLRGQEGRISFLTSDLGRAPQALTSLPNSKWVGLERRGGTYVFDLDRGAYQSLDQERRAGFSTAFDATGKWAIKCGSIQDSKEDLHLYAVNTRSVRDSSAGSSSSLAPLVLQSSAAVPGGPRKAIFSPDGKRIYFVSLEYTKRGYVHSLGYVHFAEMARRGGNKARCFVLTSSIPAPVERISISPDGSRLVLQTEKGMCLVNATDGKVTRLQFNQLIDPAETGARLLAIRDGWAGPGNGYVTFSARINLSSGRQERRIFSCRFDGSDLKALTLSSGSQTHAWDFPASDLTPYDLSRQWAMEELRINPGEALRADEISAE